jgi:hypothetical protein
MSKTNWLKMDTLGLLILIIIVTAGIASTCRNSSNDDNGSTILF